jgi:hypothetical protein
MMAEAKQLEAGAGAQPLPELANARPRAPWPQDNASILILDGNFAAARDLRLPHTKGARCSSHGEAAALLVQDRKIPG